MNFHLALNDWATSGPDAQLVRTAVFIIEQNIPVELEWDDMDAVSLHAVAYAAGGQAIGTGRLLPDGHIGRMAVMKAARGNGIGGAMLVALMREANQRAHHSVLLHAQTYVEAFYEKYGFVREGDEFMEAGIAHVQMRHVFTER